MNKTGRSHLANLCSVLFLLVIGLQPSCSGGGSSSDGNGANEVPVLVSTVSSCGSVANPCATVDFSQSGHEISPLLFGDGIEWKDYGNNVLAPSPAAESSATFRPEVMAALKDVGFTVMRYPGGTLADLFHWGEAVGAVSTRTPQFTMDTDPSSGRLVEQIPYFGPDEFVDFAGQLGTEILLTVNLGTGSAREAADWVSYWKSKGVSVKYVEVGNEMYLPGPNNSFPAMDPTVYAASFDNYARAVRAADPQVKVGMIGTMDTSSWCYPNCATHPWNEVVLTSITEKADFMAVHNSYSPATVTADESIYQAMLANTQFIEFANMLIANDIQFFASAQNKTMPLAITEHASYFLPPPTSDLNVIEEAVSRNQNLASALFSALSYHIFIKDPKVFLVNHINPLHYLWQAPITLAMPNLTTYPDIYAPQPTLSAFGHVFKAYRETAGKSYVPLTLANTPAEGAAGLPLMPPQTGVPLLDGIAAKSSSAAPGGWIFLINRSLTADQTTSVVLNNLPSGVSTIVIDQLTSSSYTARNIPVTNPTAVQFAPVRTARLPAGSSVGFTLTLPKHTLLRIKLR